MGYRYTTINCKLNCLLFAVAENYPDLKANQNFLKFQEELRGLLWQRGAA